MHVSRRSLVGAGTGVRLLSTTGLRSARAHMLAKSTGGAMVKQAHEFGLTRTMKIAVMLTHKSNVHALGPETAQGLQLTDSHYWNLNPRTPAFMDCPGAGGKLRSLGRAEARRNNASRRGVPTAQPGGLPAGAFIARSG